MSTVWPSSVERVAEYLRAAGAEARLEELSGDTATAVEAASLEIGLFDPIVDHASTAPMHPGLLIARHEHRASRVDPTIALRAE